MATGKARESVPRAPRTPNRVLRGIRENERHESRREFAEAMAQIARETGEDVYPDGKYVERLESGAITWPRAPYRNILAKLCGRPIGALGFTALVLSVSPIDHSGDAGPAPMNIQVRDAILASGMEVAQFARRVGVDPKSVQRWITQGRTPHARHRWRTCQILGREESELWPHAVSGRGYPERMPFPPEPRIPASFPISDPETVAENLPIISAAGDSRELDEVSGEELMRRRAFLLNLAVLAGLGAADTPAAVEAIRHELNQSFAAQHAEANVDEWQEIAVEYGESYPATAPAELIRPLMVDMLGMQVALQRYTSTGAQQELLRVAALLSAFTAQTVTNMGQAHEARRWWRTARNAADRSGDSYSALWVRGREIVRAMESRPVPAILQLIREAENLADQAPPEAVLEWLAGKAQTLALAGRGRDVADTLTLLQERFSTLPAGYSGSVLAWGQERLHNTESFAYSRLGNLKQTETARTSGLALYDPTNIRWPAELELNLAFCLVRNGDVTEGLNHAQMVINAMPETQRTNPIIDDGRKLLSVVPLQEQSRPDVQEYREWANASLGTSAALGERGIRAAADFTGLARLAS